MMLRTPSEGSHALPQISAATDLDLSTCLYTSTYKALCAESSLAAAFILANQRTAILQVSAVCSEPMTNKLTCLLYCSADLGLIAICT